MLEKKYRLPWGVKLTNSRFIVSPQFSVKIKNNSLLFNRVGVVISKKIDKRAVVRNRIKRLIYSIVEEMWENIQSGQDILFIIKRNAGKAKREDLYLSIKQILSREKLSL